MTVSVRKVLHLTADGTGGGAGIAASRIVKALNQYTDIECSLGALNSNDVSHKIFPKPFYYEWCRKIESKIIRLQKGRQQGQRSLGGFSSGLLKTINSSDYDLIHLHWINKNMLSISDIAKITKPLIWTLHDMWPFCGTEHYSNDRRYCDGYLPLNRGVAEKGLDIDRLIYNQKKTHWKNLKVGLACPSKWIQTCALESKALGGMESRVIHNGIDIGRFSPLNGHECRAEYGISANKYTILFGAVNSTNDVRKGYLELQGAILELCKRGYADKIQLIIFGGENVTTHIAFPFDTVCIGNIECEDKLSRLYNCADVFVGPSKQDNLPNTMVEAQSCGVPVVAFNVGGVSDIVEHKVTGYLASAFSISSLATGIEWCMHNSQAINIAVNARQRAIDLFQSKTIALSYRDYYQQTMEKYHYAK